MKNKKKDILKRIDLQMDSELKDIMKMRMKLGKEKGPYLNGTRRLTKGITNHPSWQEIKRDLIYSDLEDDRKRKR